MKLVEKLQDIIARGYYAVKDLMELDLEEEGDFYTVGIIGALEVYRNEDKKDRLITLFSVKDSQETKKRHQEQLEFLRQEYQLIDYLHEFKDEMVNQGFLHLTNQELAQKLFNRYQRKFPELRMVTHGIGQYLILPEGREVVRDHFLKREKELQDQLKALSQVISQI